MLGPRWPHVHRGEFSGAVAEMGLLELMDLLVFIMEVEHQRYPRAGQRRCRRLRIMALAFADGAIRAARDPIRWRGDGL